jgi:hypothetical protein
MKYYHNFIFVLPACNTFAKCIILYFWRYRNRIFSFLIGKLFCGFDINGSSVSGDNKNPLHFRKTAKKQPNRFCGRWTGAEGNHMYPVRNLATSISWAELHLCLTNVSMEFPTLSLSIYSAVAGAKGSFRFHQESGLEMDMTHWGILRIISPTKMATSLLARVMHLWVPRSVLFVWRLSLLFSTSNFHSVFLSLQLSTRLCWWRYTKISSTNCSSAFSKFFFWVIVESL